MSMEVRHTLDRFTKCLLSIIAISLLLIAASIVRDSWGAPKSAYAADSIIRVELQNREDSQGYFTGKTVTKPFQVKLVER
jgi:hypothetical protein